MSLAQSTFRSGTPNSAWWRDLREAKICSTTGVGLIAAFQLIARNALRAPWQSYDGPHTSRPVVDGTWGPGTNAALFAYLKLIGVTDTGAVELGGSQKTISKSSLRLMLFATYYSPRKMDLDSSGERVQRTDPPILGTAVLDQIQLPADVVLPIWLQRPGLPGDLLALGAVTPQCIPEALLDLGTPPLTPPVPTIPAVVPASFTVPAAPPPAQASGMSLEEMALWAAAIAAVYAAFKSGRKRR